MSVVAVFVCLLLFQTRLVRGRFFVSLESPFFLLELKIVFFSADFQTRFPPLSRQLIVVFREDLTSVYTKIFIVVICLPDITVSFLLYLQHLKSTRFQRFVVKQLSLKIGPVFFFCSHVFSRTYIAKMGRQIVSCQPTISIFLYLRRSVALKSIVSCLRNFFLNVSLRSKRFRSSGVIARFRSCPTFASNSRGNGCYAGYLNVAQLYHQ